MKNAAVSELKRLLARACLAALVLLAASPGSRLVAAPDFINGDYDIHWLEKYLAKGE